MVGFIGKMNIEYRAYRFVDGKARWVIVDENGKIINKNPSKENLKNLENEYYVKNIRNIKNVFTDNELLNYLKDFYEKNGRVPVASDFKNNPEYPNVDTYRKRFGSWSKALILVGMDIYKKVRRNKIYTDDELLNYLKDFYEENGRIPVKNDFENNPGYPGFSTYQKRFGSWNKALKLVGLDVDTIVKQGNLGNSYQKGRWAEILVRDHFENKSIDLSGDNHCSPCDGICHNKKTYDVKGARLRKGGLWIFVIEGKYKEEIEWFYLLAFNENYTRLMHVWRLPGDIIETNYLTIGMRPGKSKFNIENMREYEITDKFKEII